jgi:hypothetical protein
VHRKCNVTCARPVTLVVRRQEGEAVTLDLLDRVLALGPNRSCRVDRRLTPGAPAYVRTTTLLDGHRLNVASEVEFWILFPFKRIRQLTLDRLATSGKNSKCP